MPVLLLRYLPYLVAVLVVFGAGTYTGYHINPYPERYRDLRAADAIERANGEEAVRKDLQAKLDQLHATLQTNDQVINDLHAKNAAVAADRDHTNELVRRLLARAARSPAQGGGVPQAPNQPRAPPAGAESGNASLAKLLGDARDECVRNADRYDALIAQVKPQVNP